MDVTKAEKEVNSTLEKHDSVPYIVYEGTQARNERTIKRLILALVSVIILLFLSNLAWLNYMNNYDYKAYEYTQDGEGTNILGDGNGVNYYDPASGSPGSTEEKSEEG